MIATGAKKTRSYEYMNMFCDALAGRAASARTPDTAPSVDLLAVSGRTLGFLMEHPGAVHGSPGRHLYSASFRRFVLGLREEHPHIPTVSFAKATRVPLSTLKLWLRDAAEPRQGQPRGLGGERDRPRSETADRVEAIAPARPTEPACAAPERAPCGHEAIDAGDAATPPCEDHGSPRAPRRLRLGPIHAGEHGASHDTAIDVAWLAREWRRWEGSFFSFCEHVRRDARVPFRRTWIASLLEMIGSRPRKRRAGRSPDEHALAGAFTTFFPGAQWVGDGSAVSVQLNERRFTCHVELMVDTDSGAIVGASLGAREDSEAVLSALADAMRETGHRPLSLLLDNHASNRSEQVRRACKGMMLIHATRRRPQNKAHVEGAFGLFSQTVPPLEVRARSDEELASEIARLVVQTWARTLNHRVRRRSRRGRDGRSRVERYAAGRARAGTVGPARRQLARYLRRQQRALRTRAARRDPVLRKFLDREFGRLDIFDPTQRVRAAVARYPLDAAVAALAAFECARADAAVARELEGRYLLGMVRNIAADIEAERVAEKLWQSRSELRARLLEPLEQRRASVCGSAPLGSAVTACIDHAEAAEHGLARLFWLSSAAALIAEQPRAARGCLFKLAARHLGTARRMPRRERYAAIRYLSQKLLPLSWHDGVA